MDAKRLEDEAERSRLEAERLAREAAEEKTGKPLGVFYLTESDAKALAGEVLATHKQISGAA